MSRCKDILKIIGQFILIVSIFVLIGYVALYGYEVWMEVHPNATFWDYIILGGR